MSNGNIDWFDRAKKRAAILNVMRYIAAHPEAGKNCVGNDVEAHKLFEDPKIGNIKIPPGGRVVIFDTGEEALEVGSSVIIELPPNPARMPFTSPEPSDRELLSYVLGNYVHWPPKMV
jgi:hypothetical protein